MINQVTTDAANVGDAVPGQTVTVRGDFDDAGLPATHVVAIDWGDGTTDTADVTQSSGSGSFNAQHVYTGGGIYTIIVTLKDDDDATVVANAIAFVTGVGIRNGILQVIGTSGVDHVVTVKQLDGCLLISSLVPGHLRWFPVVSTDATVHGLRFTDLYGHRHASQCSDPMHAILQQLFLRGSQQGIWLRRQRNLLTAMPPRHYQHFVGAGIKAKRHKHGLAIFDQNLRTERMVTEIAVSIAFSVNAKSGLTDVHGIYFPSDMETNDEALRSTCGGWKATMNRRTPKCEVGRPAHGDFVAHVSADSPRQAV
jgi:hypothetical protein